MIDKEAALIDELSHTILHHRHVIGEAPPHHGMLAVISAPSDTLAYIVKELGGRDFAVGIRVGGATKSAKQVFGEISVGQEWVFQRGLIAA